MAVSAVKAAAEIFTTKSFRPLLRDGTSARLDELVRELRVKLDLPSTATNQDVVNAAYDVLQLSYRNEYLYKNLIASKIFVGRHRATNSTLINELAIGRSVADVVFVNGVATAYEIKTELDSPDKLRGQIADYYLAVPIVNVVVNERDVERYCSVIEDTPAGLIAVGNRWRMSTVRNAAHETTHLCIRTMFNTLRVAEIELTLNLLGATVPRVPNGLRYDTYLRIATSFTPITFHEAWRHALKSRTTRGDVELHRDPCLFPLRALLTQLGPTSGQGSKLRAWLSTGG